MMILAALRGRRTAAIRITLHQFNPRALIYYLKKIHEPNLDITKQNASLNLAAGGDVAALSAPKAAVRKSFMRGW